MCFNFLYFFFVFRDDEDYLFDLVFCSIDGVSEATSTVGQNF